MVIAVVFTWKRCGWCTRQFLNPDGISGYCSEPCKYSHLEGADMRAWRDVNGVVHKCK
jgi:hypothetical protein